MEEDIQESLIESENTQGNSEEILQGKLDEKSDNEKAKVDGESRENIVSNEEEFSHDENDDGDEDDDDEDLDNDDNSTDKNDDLDKDDNCSQDTKKEIIVEKKLTKEEEEARRKKYADYPMINIKKVHDNDVLYGRGGGTNHHPGNKIYRKTVEERKLDYVNSKRLDKPLVALDIIRKWRSQSPPGRFLKMDETTGLWSDVGDKKAREKTSQALREKAPDIRKKQEEENMVKEGKDPSSLNQESTEKKMPRGTEASKFQPQEQVKHAILARDHSLGREYLGSGETVAIAGFSWDSAPLERIPSYGSVNPYPNTSNPVYGSHGRMPPYYPLSRAGSSQDYPPCGPVPAPEEYYRNTSHEDRRHNFEARRYESWARIPSSDGTSRPPIPSYSVPSYEHRRSESFNNAHQVPLSREHSLALNPLREASLTFPPNHDFESRSQSGYWGPSHYTGHPTHSHGITPQGYDASHYYRSMTPPIATDPMPSYGPQASMNHVLPETSSSSRIYEIPSDIAKSWSTQSDEYDASGSMYGNQDITKTWDVREIYPDVLGEEKLVKSSCGKNSAESLGRPDLVKRMTSNQNENIETKRDYTEEQGSIKRLALNRDNSLASNRLKAVYAPGALKKPQTLDNEMRNLSISMEQSSLDNKPRALAVDERSSTIDIIAMELMPKPLGIQGLDRKTTVDELGMLLGVDDFIPSVDGPLPKPPTLRTVDRFTTAEFLDLVNEPLGEDDLDPRPSLAWNDVK